MASRRSEKWFDCGPVHDGGEWPGQRTPGMHAVRVGGDGPDDTDTTVAYVVDPANAPLISLAPEMTGLLEEALDHIDAFYGSYVEDESDASDEERDFGRRARALLSRLPGDVAQSAPAPAWPCSECDYVSGHTATCSRYEGRRPVAP